MKVQFSEFHFAANTVRTGRTSKVIYLRMRCRDIVAGRLLTGHYIDGLPKLPKVRKPMMSWYPGSGACGRGECIQRPLRMQERYE